MESVLRPAHHRLPVHLPMHTSVEEVILARKMIPSSKYDGIYHHQSSLSAREAGPQRGKLASPSSPASYLSHLPPESYARDVSKRLGKRPRSRAVRRADDPGRRGRSCGSFTPPPQLRPLTGVSPPSTAQTSFGFADYRPEGLRHAASSGTPLSGRRTAKWGQDENNSNSHDNNDHVAFLRDKCNALAARLQQVETQLLTERAEGKHLRHSPSAAPSDALGTNSMAGDDRTQLQRASTADARLAPRIAAASSHGGSSQGTRSFTPEIQEGVYHRISGRRDEKADGYGDQGAGEGGYELSAITDGPGGSPEAFYASPGDGAFPPLSERERGRTCSPTGKPSGLMPPRGDTTGRLVPPSAGGFANTRAEGDVMQPGKIGGKLDVETRHCEKVEKEIAQRFAVVADGVEKLENVFSSSAQIVEHRANAITTITSAIRMFLQRCRYLRAKETLKAADSIPALQSLRAAISRGVTIETGLNRMESRRHRSIKAKYFKSWSSVVGADELRKIDIKLFGERVKTDQEHRLVRDVFRALRDQTVGPMSSREIARRGHARMAEARERLLARAATRGEEGLVVTLAMVRQEMSRGAVAAMERKMKVNLCRSMVENLKKAVLFRKACEVRATENFRRWATRRVMKGWNKWAALKARGIDRHLMTGYKGRVGSRYNPNKVASFTRRREMNTVFTAWARKSRQLGIAKRMQRKKLTVVVVGAFEKWKMETKKTKQVKKIAVGMWADFSLKELGEPFRMWYIFSESSKRQTIEQERLLKLHRRAKNRKKCYTILKAWRHLAVYGRIEGMYTRSQLMSSLAEQKEHTKRLVGRVDELAGGLGDMEELAMDYRSQMIIRQKETQEQAAGMDRQTMALHHAEQEIVRLQSLLGTVAKIAPSVCKVVHKAAPDFDFLERGFTPLTEARAEAIKRAEDARVEELVADRIAEKIDAEHKLGGSNSDQVGNDEGGQLKVPGSAQGHRTQQLNGTKPVTAVQAPIEKTDAETQACIRVDPEAAARAAVASAALALGTKPPVLPRELARLDRVEWVLRRTTLTEVSLGLRMEDDESVGGCWGVGSGGGHDSSDCDEGALGSEERSTTRGTGVGGRVGGAGDIVKLDGQQKQQQQLQQTTNDAEAPAFSQRREQNEGESVHPTTPADTSTAESFGDSPPAAALAAVSVSPKAPATAVSSPDEKSGGGSRAKGEEEDEEEDDDVLERLSALFEFLRSGNSCVLPPDIQAAWESRPDLGLGLLAADDHVYAPRPHAVAPSSSAAGGVANNTNDGTNIAPNGGASKITRGGAGGAGGGRRGVSSWRGLCGERRAGKGEPMTFHDLRMALTATAPPGRRTESTNDRLERRLVEGRRRADGIAAALWGNERRQQSTANLYAPSQFSSPSRQQPSPARMNE